MNALDHGRDNRLRLWFLGMHNWQELDQKNCKTPVDFARLMQRLETIADRCLTHSGKVVLIVGEVERKSQSIDTARIATARPSPQIPSFN